MFRCSFEPVRIDIKCFGVIRQVGYTVSAPFDGDITNFALERVNRETIGKGHDNSRFVQMDGIRVCHG